MSGTQSPSSPSVFQTRQAVDPFVIAQTPLGGAASAVSDIVESAGHSAVKVLVRTDAGSAGTIEVYQSVTNPTGGPIFVLTESKATAPDPKTGEQVAFLNSKIFGEFTRIVYVNGATLQTKFQMSAYLIPVGG